MGQMSQGWVENGSIGKKMRKIVFGIERTCFGQVEVRNGGIRGNNGASKRKKSRKSGQKLKKAQEHIMSLHNNCTNCTFIAQELHITGGK